LNKTVKTLDRPSIANENKRGNRAKQQQTKGQTQHQLRLTPAPVVFRLKRRKAGKLSQIEQNLSQERSSVNEQFLHQERKEERTVTLFIFSITKPSRTKVHYTIYTYM
jgi:hypothetical protein